MSEKQAPSQFINWEVTPEYSGTLVGFGKIPTEKGENFFMEFDDGKRVGISATLKRAISYARKNKKIGFNIGDLLSFTYDGKTKTKDSKPLNIIRLAVNDIEVKPNEVEEAEFFEALELAEIKE